MNRIIKGDNAIVMKSLDIPVDLMLWDPPYNTGRKDMMYEDKRKDWILFMKDRLQLAKDLLKESGSIAIHISYHELFRLGMLMDEVFGEHNRLGIINWECAYSPKNDNRGIPSTTDYVLIYAKNKKQVFRGIIPRTAEMDSRYKSPDNDKRVWGSCNLSAASDSPDYQYGIQNPFTKRIYHPGSRSWRFSKNKITQMLSGWGIEYVENENGDLVVKEGESLDRAIEIQKNGPWPCIYFGNKGQCSPRYKLYRDELKNEGRVLGTYWDEQELGCISLPYYISGHNSEAKKLLKNIIPTHDVFSTPKPLRLTELLIQLLCPLDGTVLDAFAGSGTTAHAVLSLNAKDTDSDRKFVLIEKEDFIESITVDRIKRVSNGNWFNPGKDTSPLSGLFEYVNLGV